MGNQTGRPACQHLAQQLIKSMPAKKTAPEEHIEHHKDGSVWAKGQTVDGVPVGYWEWFRLDGTKMRSGYFETGQQVGEWTTYDKKGQVYKVTKPKTKPPPVSWGAD